MGCKWRDDETVPLICPTCQSVCWERRTCRGAPATLHGVVFDILVGTDEWLSGDDPMTGAQASYLKTLCEQAGTPEAFNDNLTKAEASKLIDEMRGRREWDNAGRTDDD